MNQLAISLLKSVASATGAVVAGPAGAAVGGVIGGFAGILLPGASGVIEEIFKKVTIERIQTVAIKAVDRLNPGQKEYINHDLQTAFRDALQRAVYDIGGSECFPAVWKASPRDVPEDAIYPHTHLGRKLWMEDSPLTIQIRDCFQSIEAGIASGKILPLDPPASAVTASAQKILMAENPQALGDAFFEECLAPALSVHSLLFREVPDLYPHLHRYLFDRTLIHLGELLKHRSPAWRAFNRMFLENLREQVSDLQSGQNEILQRLDNLLSEPGGESLAAWSTGTAELLTATGRLEKQVGEGFEALTSRVMAQHGEILARFDRLNLTADRIEGKVDRVLHFLENGQYFIEGEATVPLHKKPSPGEPPFKGLEFFTEEDAGLFFGRERLIAALVSRLYSAHFLAVIGASGSGKSSVVRAGVIPVLKGSKVMEAMPLLPPNCQKWPVVVLTPSAHPLESLAAALTQTASQARELAQSLKTDPHLLDLTARRLAGAAGANRFLLVVDQFEEIFTQAFDPAEAAAFVDALMDSAAPGAPGVITLILILRADFYAQCAQYETLRSAIAASQEYIGPMNRDELRQAIEEPARRGGWKFEPGLVDIMIQDAGREPGALPLLSHALLETWQHRSGHTMTLESYAESGGVRQAIAHTAEQVYNHQLDSAQQQVARRIFLRLTNLGDNRQDTRRRAELSELILRPEDRPAVESVLKALIDARLVTASEGTVEVAHEALIEHWPTLREWLDEGRQGLLIHRRLTDAAAEWQRASRDDGLLFRGVRLAETAEYADANPEALNRLEAEFFQASRDLAERENAEKEAQRQRELDSARRLAESETQRAEIQTRSAARLRQRAILLAGALAVAAILAILAIVFGVQSSQNARVAADNAAQAQSNAATAQASSSEAQRQSKIAQTRELAARSSAVLPRDADLSLWLALQAQRINPDPAAPLPEIQTSLYQALLAAPYQRALAVEECPYFYCIRSAIFSPDGNLVLTTGMTQANVNTLLTSDDKVTLERIDSPAILWNRDGKLIEELYVPGSSTVPALAVAFSPDGKTIAAGFLDGSVGLWSSSGSLIASTRAHTGAAVWVGFSPDGARLLTTGQDGVAALWKSDLTPLQKLAGSKAAMIAAAFSPDGSTIATAGYDRVVRLWSSDGALLKELSGHTAWIHTVAFNSDGAALVSASWDGTARLWDVAAGKSTAVLKHSRSVYSAVFSPNGKQILTGDRDGLARLWNLDGTQAAVFEGHSGPVNQAIFSPDGKTVVTTSDDSTIRIWSPDGAELRVLHGHNSFTYTAAFNADGRWLVTTGSDQRLWKGDYYYAGAARIWDAALVSLPTSLDFKSAVSAAEFNPDGRQILTGASDGYHLWQPGKPIFNSPDNDAFSLLAASFSPDGSRFVTSGSPAPGLGFSGAEIHNSQDGSVITQLSGHTSMVTSASYSPDGERILTSGYDGTVRLWKSDGSPLRTIQVEPPGSSLSIVFAARFSPDGKLIAATGASGKVSLWNSSDGSLVNSFTSSDVAASSLDFSPDGRLLLVGSYDNYARIHKLDGTLLDVLKGHAQLINGVRFDHTGNLMATASEDGTVRLWVWNGRQAQSLATLEGHTGAVVSVSFSPDNRRLASTSWDGTTRIWEIYPDQASMTSAANNRLAGYSPSDTECDRYLHQPACPAGP